MSFRFAGFALLIGVAAFGAARGAPALGDFGQLPSVEQMRLSPSGDKIAAIMVVDDERRVVVKTPDGADVFAIDVGKLKPRRVQWLGDRHLLIETSATLDIDELASARLETLQSSVLDVATGKIQYVFHNESKVFHATYGFYGYSKQGDREYGYFGGLTLSTGGNLFSDFDKQDAYVSHGHTDLYRVDLTSGDASMVFGGSELMGVGWFVNTQGAVVGHEEYDRKGLWRLYADPKNTQLIAEAPDPLGDISTLGLGRGPGTLLVQRPLSADGDYAYFEYATAAHAPGVRLLEDVGVESFERDPTTDLLIGAVTNAYPPRTILFDPALQGKFDKVGRVFPGESVVLESQAANLDRMVVLTEGPGDSGTYYFVDLASRQIHAIGWRYPKVLQSDVGAVKVVSYKAADGLPMEGVLTLPPGRDPKALPLVVLPHGGPQTRDVPGFDWWAQAYASRGYAVFQPNFRGSDGYGKAFRDAGFGEWGRKMQTDVSDGVAELVRQGIVDPHRACIIGGSYGGYVALAGVTVQQGLYRCAVAVGGVADLPEMLAWETDRHSSRSLAVRYWRKFMGADTAGGGALAAISPGRLAARADAPILLIVGKDDTVVAPQQSLEFAASLRQAGKPVELLQLPDEDHWLSRGATRNQMLKASLDFLERYNPPS
jgi:dipeptidyl aminopeptidase/acylaminoacyl peptidase